MGEFNPNNPADVWIQKHKRKAAPVLYVTLPLALVFLIKVVAGSFDQMPGWIWLGGIFCLLTAILACANLLDEVTRLEKRVEELEGRD